MRSHTVTVVLLCLAASGSALAQSHRCSSDGRTYYSDRPCNGNTKLQMYGPAPTYPERRAERHADRYSPSTSAIPRTQEHVQYLSPACASISEAIRTGPARGVRGDVIRGLHDEYRDKCSVEDQDARAQVQQQLHNQRQNQLAQREMSAAEKQQARERAERCGGMRDVIGLKRKREAELNPKEVEALRNLEKTYNEVCLAR